MRSYVVSKQFETSTFLIRLLTFAESELSTLRRENRKNMLLAVIVLVFCAVVYMFFKTE